jgi:hypothetical protein
VTCQRFRNYNSSSFCDMHSVENACSVGVQFKKGDLGSVKFNQRNSAVFYETSSVRNRVAQ